MQISLYKLYIKDVFPTDIHAHVIKRAQDLSFPFEVPLHALSLTPTCKLLRGLRAHDAIRVLRTWVNAWCTSTRFHEEMRLPCLFGCFAEEDRQSHYSMCPHLFAIQRHLYPPTHSDPLIRIGLVDTSVDNLKLVACTYSAYHSLKFTLASKTNQDDLVPSPHPPYHHKMQECFYAAFAEAFHAEATELGLTVQRFDTVTFHELAYNTQDYPCPLLATPFAPGAPTSRTSGSIFVPASCPHAHNPLLRAAPTRNTFDCSVPAPGISSSRAGSGTFVRAAQVNAHTFGPSDDVVTGPRAHHNIRWECSRAKNGARRPAPSAPGASTSQASGSFFVPAASPKAHNTILHTNRAAPMRNTSDRTAASAPGVSPSRAGPSTFIRAAQANAHNPFLQSANSSASGRDCRAVGSVPYPR